MTSPDTEFISILGAAGNPEEPSRDFCRVRCPETLPILGLSDIVIFPGHGRAAAGRNRPEHPAH